MEVRTIVEIAEGVSQGALSARQVLEESLAAIDARNPLLNAFVMTDFEAARAAADDLDQRVSRGERPGPLAGVPFGVKDTDDCAGFRTTRGSLFEKNSPVKTVDSPHVARLRAAGAIPVGKTAAPEFGMDSAIYTKAWGTSRNPWNPAKTPGGSSGGSAAAVASGMVPLATASDGGGSTRSPAAFTGLLGLKPSHGRIARANGFNDTGVLGAYARTVGDTARCLDVMAGPGYQDRQSLPTPGVRYEAIIETLEVAGLKAMWSPDLGYAVVEPEVAEIAEIAARGLVQVAGLVLQPDDFRPIDILPHWAAVAMSRLEDDLTHMGVLPDGFDDLTEKTQQLLLWSRELRGKVDLQHAVSQQMLFEQQVAGFFRDHDLLMTPSTACPAFDAERVARVEIIGRNAIGSSVEPFGVLANICWNPSISIPAGFTSDGLPVGLQITARRHRDDILLRLARLYERAFPWPYPDALGKHERPE
jgi:aspartyl-tRNA(Asn)/glutamyl-tRNA(Gln) amidotransferase subunit A